MLSTKKNNTQRITARTNLQEFINKPAKTYFIITVIVALIALLHLLPSNTQKDLAHLFRTQQWLTAVALIAILGLTYFNWIAGLLLLFLIICVMFPFAINNNNNDNTTTTNNTVEGFKSNNTDEGGDDSISLNNRHIKSLFSPGLLGKRVQEYRAINKRVKAENAAKEKSMEIFNSKRSAKLGSKNEGRTRENFREIELRRFDPVSEDDMNLLLTMEHCADIQNRIKYVYEDTKYLKKYIREKLEDIVDLLDLVPEDE